MDTNYKCFYYYHCATNSYANSLTNYKEYSTCMSIGMLDKATYHPQSALQTLFIWQNCPRNLY